MPTRSIAPSLPPAIVAAASPPAEATHALTLPADAAGQRFDVALARALPQFSRARLRAWIDAGRVTQDGQPAAPTRKVRGGERVAIRAEALPEETAFLPEAIALTIVAEDDALIVVDKPAGLVVHPGAGNWEGTLLNALLHHAPQLRQVPRAGIVHRLDKDTSGLLVVAKTLAVHTALVRALQARIVTREYLALATGDLARGDTVDAPIGRHPTRRTTMAVVATGKAARTHFSVLERFGRATLLRCRLETGRTHQIRVHLASLGHPLVGDPAYGRTGRSRFHARRCMRRGSRLDHPVTGRACAWESPLPRDFQDVLSLLRGQVAP